MTFRFRIAPSLVAGLLVAAPGGMQVLAQTSQAAVSTPTPPTKPAGHSAAIERRIAELHTRLKITPGEQKPFDDFAQVMRDNAQRMDGLVAKRQTAFETGNAVEQMQSYSAMAQAHAEDMQHLTDAFTTLYNALSADQKKAADQSFRQFARSRGSAAG